MTELKEENEETTSLSAHLFSNPTTDILSGLWGIDFGKISDDLSNHAISVMNSTTSNSISPGTGGLWTTTSSPNSTNIWTTTPYINSNPSYTIGTYSDDSCKVDPDNGDSIKFDVDEEIGKAAEDKMKRDLSGLSKRQEEENKRINRMHRCHEITFYPTPIPVSKFRTILSKVFSKKGKSIPNCYSCGSLFDSEMIGMTGLAILLRCRKCGALRLWYTKIGEVIGCSSSDSPYSVNHDYTVLTAK